MPMSKSITAICQPSSSKCNEYKPSLQSSDNPPYVCQLSYTNTRAVSCSLLDVVRTMQTSLPSTKEPASKDNAETIRENLRCTNCHSLQHQNTLSSDPIQLPVTPQVIGNTPLTGIVACTSSPAEKVTHLI